MSIVVATYNTAPDRLHRLMRSVSAQTMPAHQIEIVFVDDGSTDDTVPRLRRIARTRSQVRVRSIPNSGWAGRPRNIGVRLARGTYVLFMDHDDVLFPRALERAWAYGHAHRADVVNAKEVRTAGWSWGWDAFTADVPLANGIDPNPLIPMTPHKLYRRNFLREHQLRFREGPRVFWEDIYFNLAAFTHGARVAVLSSTPFYHWVSTGENNSDSYSRPDPEYWANLGQLLSFHATELADVPGGPEQIAHQLRARVLPFAGPRLLRLPAHDVERIYRSAERLVAEHAPAGRDVLLRSVDRCRVELVRHGDLRLQRELAECDAGVTTAPSLTGVSWDGTELVVSATATLDDATGRPVPFDRVAAGWRRRLPDPVGAHISVAARDITRDLTEASFELSVKGRSTRATWAVPGRADVACRDQGSGAGALSATITARVDPVAFAAAHDVQSDAVFDFAARLTAIGYTSHRALRASDDTMAAALLDGTAAVAYRNASGALSLDVRAARSLTRLTRPEPGTATVIATPTSDGSTVTVRLELPGVHCTGQTRLVGEVVAAEDHGVPAALVGEDGRAFLSFAGSFPRGVHVLHTRFGGQTGPTGLVLCVEDDGVTLATADDGGIPAV